ncbi:MAG: hypothetical protein PHF51_03940 [Candidatus ainarchaeum sp.]|nr:hypothetical protein [Candidatus ainarchaeum sp.]
MPKQKGGDEAKGGGGTGNNRTMMLVAYILTWLTGLIVYLTAGKEDEEVRFHALQAILLGVAMVALWIVGIITLVGWVITIPLDIVLLLYGWYAGYKAYSSGEKILIPYIGDYAEKHAGKE